MNPLVILSANVLIAGFHVIVSNIDGPKEIIEEVVDYVYTYEVDVDDCQNDIQNFTQTLKEIF